jgi:hypothetical protein
MSNIKKQPKDSKMINEKSFHSFKTIADFVSQLSDVYGKTNHEILLYNHLLSKTKMTNKPAISKNIQLFNEFCARNSKAIIERNPKQIISHKIAYSDRAFINLYDILNDKGIDSETTETVWNHLLVIQATLDPSSDARNIFNKLKQTPGSDNDSSESKFLDGFMSKIEGSINKDNIDADPMSAATNILQSGVLNDLVGSIDTDVKSGKLDLGKLVGTVQKMLGGLTSNMENSGGGDGNIDMNAMMTSMMSMMGNMGQGQGQGGNPFGALSGLMGNMAGGAQGGGDNPLSALSGLMSGGGLSGLDPDKMKELIEKELEIEKNKTIDAPTSMIELLD